MIIFDLPTDLVVDILSRVPAKSLIQSRTTCKQWNALFIDRRFRETHFGKAAKQSRVLMLRDYRVCSTNVYLNFATPYAATPFIEFKSELSMKNSQVDIARVFHCDGLLLCTTKDDRLVVWNPCLGNTKWIPLGLDYKRDFIPTFFLGYINNNKSCRSYKLLRCWCWNYNKSSNHTVQKCEIYEFSTDSWTGFDYVSLDYLIRPDTACVSLKGNTYWLPSYKKTQFLLCFDYTTERFKRLCLPPIENVSNMFLSVTREEKLSVLIRNKHKSEMEVWMAKNIDEATLSWRKSFTVDMKLHNITCYPNSFLIYEEKRLVLCSRVRSSSQRPTYIFNYVPSLFQIQRCRRGRRGRRGTRKARK